MMDSLSRRLRRALTEMLVAGVLISCAWIMGRSVTSPEDLSPGKPGGTEIEILPPVPIQPPQFLQQRATARWLPPLSDQTREVLAAACPDQLPEHARLTQNEPSLAGLPSILKTELQQSEEEIEQLPQLTGPALLDNQFQSVNKSQPAQTPRQSQALNQRVSEEDMPHNNVSDGRRHDIAADESDEIDDSTGASLLLPPQLSVERSEQLERIARQADKKIHQGYELASRGAHFAARAEFIAALRLLAQGLDTEYTTTIHSRSLAAGLTAVKEVDDFIPGGSRLEAHLDIGGLIDSHSTPVLKNTDVDKLTSFSAVKHYLTFAQEQLGVATGHEVAGSMALHALGKLYGVLSTTRAPESKAVTFYQAALLAFPYNYMASNDLGVLLARSGNYNDAHAALLHSVSTFPQSSGWHNLSVVYGKLGREADARQAEWLASQARQIEQAQRKSRSGPSSQLVRWVDSATFAGSLSQRHVAGDNMPLQTASPWPEKNKRK